MEQPAAAQRLLQHPVHRRPVYFPLPSAPEGGLPRTQDNPAGRNSIMYCDRQPGDIGFTGVDFVVNYGPDVTEPLAGHGAIAAKVDPEYLDDFYKAGKAVWNNHVTTHTLVTMVMERKES